MRGMHPMEIKRANTLLWTVFPIAAGVARNTWERTGSVSNRLASRAAGRANGARRTPSGPRTRPTSRGTSYRPLDQINASNFNKLEVAWRFKTDNLGPFPEYKLEGTPLMVNGVIYTTGGTRRSVVALDAKTGEMIWAHSMREGKRAANSPRQLSGRGVSYLDRRARRRPRDLRDHRLSAGGAQCQNRCARSTRLARAAWWTSRSAW